MFSSYRYSYVVTRVKNNQMVSCRAPGCTNRAHKNSSLITVVTTIIMNNYNK